jgi:hypothetical protein
MPVNILKLLQHLQQNRKHIPSLHYHKMYRMMTVHQSKFSCQGTYRQGGPCQYKCVHCYKLESLIFVLQHIVQNLYQI